MLHSHAKTLEQIITKVCMTIWYSAVQLNIQLYLSLNILPTISL